MAIIADDAVVDDIVIAARALPAAAGDLVKGWGRRVLSSLTCVNSGLVGELCGGLPCPGR